MKKVKIFISQPMRGKTHEQIMEEREKAIQKVKSHFHAVGTYYDVQILDTYFGNQYGYGDAPPLYYLGKSILLLSEADFAYFAPGWEETRGCVIERTCCELYGIPILV